MLDYSTEYTGIDVIQVSMHTISYGARTASDRAADIKIRACT